MNSSVLGLPVAPTVPADPLTGNFGGVWHGPNPPDNPEDGWQWFNTDNGILYIYSNGDWNQVGPNSFTAYWGGTITPVPLGQNPISWDGTATNVVTFATPHGIKKPVLVIITGTPASAFNVNCPYYFAPLSTITGAFYLTLNNAYADTNRVSGGTAVTWSFRVITYSGVISSGFDLACPIGAWSTHPTIFLELNLSKPLAGLFAMVTMGNINGLVRLSDGASSNGWYLNVAPVIVSTTLIRFGDNWALTWISVPSGGGPPTSPQGTWLQLGNSSFMINFGVLG